MPSLPVNSVPIQMAQRLIPGAPGSGYARTWTDLGLPGAGMVTALTPTAPDANPARAAALSAAYLNPANWNLQGGDRGLPGAGPGGGMFQPDVQALYKAAAQMMSSPNSGLPGSPLNRFAGLSIGDTPGGAQSAVLATRGQRLQALQADRNWALALEQLKRQDAQQQIANRFAGERLNLDRASTGTNINLANKGFDLNTDKFALDELRILEGLKRDGVLPPGFETYPNEFKRISESMPKQKQALSDSVQDLWNSAYESITQVVTPEQAKASQATLNPLKAGTVRTIPGVTVVADRSGLPSLEFDERMAGAMDAFTTAMQKFRSSGAMAKVLESQLAMEKLEDEYNLLSNRLSQQLPLTEVKPQPTWVLDRKQGKYVQVKPQSRQASLTPMVAPRRIVPDPSLSVPQATVGQPVLSDAQKAMILQQLEAQAGQGFPSGIPQVPAAPMATQPTNAWFGDSAIWPTNAPPHRLNGRMGLPPDIRFF